MVHYFYIYSRVNNKLLPIQYIQVLLVILDILLKLLKISGAALLEKQSKFSRNNMKCKGKLDTTYVKYSAFSALHFML